MLVRWLPYIETAPASESFSALLSIPTAPGDHMPNSTAYWWDNRKLRENQGVQEGVLKHADQRVAFKDTMLLGWEMITNWSQTFKHL